MKQIPSNDESKKEETNESFIEDEVDYSKLTDQEKDKLILDMHAEEMMKKQSEMVEILDKTKKKKKHRKKDASSKGNIAPGFSWVVFKMSVAMTFSLTFVFLGIVLIFVALFKAFGDTSIYDWHDLVFGLVGLVLFVLAWLIFRYLIKS